jgi:hypothetical protein
LLHGLELSAIRGQLRFSAFDLRLQLCNPFVDDITLPFKGSAAALELVDLASPDLFEVGIVCATFEFRR